VKRIILILSLLFVTSGCSIWPKFSFGSKDDNASSLDRSKSENAALDRISEMQKRENELRQELHIKYEKFRDELQNAYKNREKIDDINFDKISHTNYGIYAATKDLVDTDKRIKIANLKSQENMARLMPLAESVKHNIRKEIDTEAKSENSAIDKIYESKIKDGLKDAQNYEDADKIVKEKEAEKIRIKEEQRLAFAKLEANKAEELAKLKKESEEAINIAKEKTKAEMVGWIVKSLLAVGVLMLIIGFLTKSPTFIISAIGSLGLAYMAATIPFWVVAVVMGLLIIVMIIVDPKTGKIHLFNAKSSKNTQDKQTES
jgi:hypothetical protein